VVYNMAAVAAISGRFAGFLLNIPVGAGANAATPPQLLGNLVDVRAGRQMAVASRYNISPAIDVFVSVQGTDLASVAGKVSRWWSDELPKRSQVAIRGQVETMQSSFIGLGVGLAMAIVLVYLLVVVNFQSWIDAAIIIAALPAALAALRGCSSSPAPPCRCRPDRAIMTSGVATANSILIVAFARQRKEDGATPLAAALEAGSTRIRLVLMTALAMIIGMIPMALGLGEGPSRTRRWGAP
jgi:multidrug efflux pump subunit AcrB